MFESLAAFEQIFIMSETTTFLCNLGKNANKKEGPNVTTLVSQQQTVQLYCWTKCQCITQNV